MPHYKDTNNKIHFLESAKFTHLLPAGCVQIADAEAEEIRKVNIYEPTQAEKEAQETELLIQLKIRQLAIKALQAEGKITIEGKIANTEETKPISEGKL